MKAPMKAPENSESKSRADSVITVPSEAYEIPVGKEDHSEIAGINQNVNNEGEESKIGDILASTSPTYVETKVRRRLSRTWSAFSDTDVLRLRAFDGLQPVSGIITRWRQRWRKFSSPGSGETGGAAAVTAKVLFQGSTVQEKIVSHQCSPESPVEGPTVVSQKSLRQKMTISLIQEEKRSNEVNHLVKVESSQAVSSTGGTMSSVQIVTTETEIKASAKQLMDFISSRDYLGGCFKEKPFMALLETLPVDICRLRLDHEPNQCIANTRSSRPPKPPKPPESPKRCSRKGSVYGGLTFTPAKSVEGLCDTSIAGSLIKKIILRMNDPILCAQHYKIALNALQECIPLIQERIKAKDNNHNLYDAWLARRELLALQYWTNEILGIGLPPSVENDTSTGPSQQYSMSIKEQYYRLTEVPLPAGMSSTELDVYIINKVEQREKFSRFRFIPKRPVRWKKPQLDREQNLKEELKDKIMQPLKYSEGVQSGHVYAFTFPIAACAGCIKIGISVDPEKRVHEQWSPHWRIVPQFIIGESKTPSAEGCTIPAPSPIPHVRRVEDLIYIELKEMKMVMACCNTCGANHMEWVRTSPEHVKAVVKKWSHWMRKEPYDLERRWKLKESFVADLEDICKPTPIPQST
jgi:T5orf172 domain